MVKEMEDKRLWICCSKWIHLCKSDLHELCMSQLACMRCVTTNLFKVVYSRAATLKSQGFSAADYKLKYLVFDHSVTAQILHSFVGLKSTE